MPNAISTPADAAAALAADPEIGAIQLIEPEVRGDQPGRWVTSCPGCAASILVPDLPTSETWADTGQWCAGCGGTAARADHGVTLTERDAVNVLLNWLADGEREPTETFDDGPRGDRCLGPAELVTNVTLTRRHGADRMDTMETKPQTHPDDPAGHALYNPDGSTHIEALVALLNGQNPDLVIVRRADVVAVIEKTEQPKHRGRAAWNRLAQIRS